MKKQVTFSGSGEGRNKTPFAESLEKTHRTLPFKTPRGHLFPEHHTDGPVRGLLVPAASGEGIQRCPAVLP